MDYKFTVPALPDYEEEESDCDEYDEKDCEEQKEEEQLQIEAKRKRLISGDGSVDDPRIEEDASSEPDEIEAGPFETCLFLFMQVCTLIHEF